MSRISPKFCSNCGESLQKLNANNEAIKNCPKCKIDLFQVGGEIPLRNSSVVDQLPYKSPGTAALIAFIGGIFALPGLGHIYWKCWKRNWNTNIWYHHLCSIYYYYDILFFFTRSFIFSSR